MKGNLHEYSQILESLHEGIWIIDENANITFVNSRMAEMMGYTVDEMLGKHMFSFMDECGKAMAIRNFQRWKLGVAEQHEFDFLDKDGRLIHTLVNVSPIINDKGHFAGTIAGIVDISERKRLEEALQESEERYRDLSENANDLIQSVTPDGRFLYVNKKWREMLGYSEEEVTGLTVWDIIHPDSIHHCKEVFRKVMSGETVNNVEAVFVAKDGRSVTVEGNINSRYKGGKVVATRGIFRDITERKQIEQALQKSEAEYKLLFDNSSAAISYYDTEGKLVLLNRQGAINLKGEMRDFIGKSIYDILPDLADFYMKRFRKIMKEGKGARFEDSLELPVGKRWFSSDIQPVKGEGGSIRGIQIISNDITERKRAQEALRNKPV